MPLEGADSRRPKERRIRCGCTSVPPGEYDKSIRAAAAMQIVATITVASYLFVNLNTAAFYTLYLTD